MFSQSKPSLRVYGSCSLVDPIAVGALVSFLGMIYIYMYIYYIDTDEIPGFLLLLKNHIFTARSEHIIFIFHM